VVVGDTPYDIAAASKIGLAAVAVRCGGFSEEDLGDAAAIYDGPQELNRIFPGWLPA
jgi:phosphoglycolate phosphatase-like HAD superfamily hydrolase